MITPRAHDRTWLVKLTEFPEELRQLTGQRSSNELIIWFAGGALHACPVQLKGRCKLDTRPPAGKRRR